MTRKPAMPLTVTITVAGTPPVVIDPTTFDDVAIDHVDDLIAAMKTTVAVALNDAAAYHARTATTPCILCGKDSGRSATKMGAGSALCAACVPDVQNVYDDDGCGCAGRGWLVATLDVDAFNLERCDECLRFDSDEDAAAHVRKKINHR